MDDNNSNNNNNSEEENNNNEQEQEQNQNNEDQENNNNNENENNEEKKSELQNANNEEKKSELQNENNNDEKKSELQNEEQKSQISKTNNINNNNTSRKPSTTNSKIVIESIDKPKNNIFDTEVNKPISKGLFSFHDLIVPGGKNAKLCLINEPFNKNLRITEIVDHFNFYEPFPVINIIGGNTNRKTKLMAGLSRVALNCRAIVIDSGIQTGIEKFCLRKNLNLIGIAPENKIEYPKNTNEFSNKLLTNGHTHFILLGKDDKKLNWGDEIKFKINFIERLIKGKKGAFNYECKVVGILLGNIQNSIDECLIFIEKKWPLILIDDSDLASEIKELRENENNKGKFGEKMDLIANYNKLIEIDDDSENLASAVHICLTLSF
jgi:hypothetical protein